MPFKTQYVFGVSEWELFHTLTAGATLVVCDDAILRQPYRRGDVNPGLPSLHR